MNCIYFLTSNRLYWSKEMRYNNGHELVLLAPSHALINVHMRGEAMTSIDSTLELIPVKPCSKCKQVFPATVEFFGVRKDRDSGLHSWCRECLREKNRNYAAKHRERCHAVFHEWYQKNIVTLRAKKRVYAKTNSEKIRRYRVENCEKVAAGIRTWKKAHPDKVKAQKHRRRANKNNALVSAIPFDEKAQLKRQKGECYYCSCKLTEYHIDHVIPLSRGGSDHPDNMVLACSFCNLSKNNKLPHEWSKGGRLL